MSTSPGSTLAAMEETSVESEPEPSTSSPTREALPTVEPDPVDVEPEAPDAATVGVPVDQATWPRPRPAASATAAAVPASAPVRSRRVRAATGGGGGGRGSVVRFEPRVCHCISSIHAATLGPWGPLERAQVKARSGNRMSEINVACRRSENAQRRYGELQHWSPRLGARWPRIRRRSARLGRATHRPRAENSRVGSRRARGRRLRRVRQEHPDRPGEPCRRSSSIRPG